MFGSSLYSFRYTGPLRGSHYAEVAHGESEFDTAALEQGSASKFGLVSQKMNNAFFNISLN